MNLDNRQKVLVAVFVGVLVIWQGSGVVWGVLFGPFTARNNDIAALKVRLAEKEAAKHKLDLAERRLRGWERRSLPPNPIVASTLYHFWVQDLANKHSLERLTVAPKRIGNGVTNSVFTRIPVTVTAECKMLQLCQFLYDFYRADLMHKVNLLAIESQDHKSDPTLKVTLELEGLALTSAKARTDSLFEGKQAESVADAMSKKSFDDYRMLVDANRFIRGYNGPPKPIDPPAPPAAPFDSAPYTKLVAVIEAEGNPEASQAWLYDSTSNQQIKLYAGKEFEIAGVKGKVVEFGKRFVKFEVKNKIWRLEMGDNLKQMVELKPDGATPSGTPAQPQAPANAPPSAPANTAPMTPKTATS